MSLCEISTWNEELNSNDFYHSNIEVGEAIVEQIEAIIRSIPGGDKVAWIDSKFVYSPNFCGWGKQHLQVRLSISELPIDQRKNIVRNIAEMGESNLRETIVETIVETVGKRKKLQEEYIIQQENEHAEAKLNNSAIIKEEKAILEEIASLDGDALIDRLRLLGWDEEWDHFETCQTFRHPKALHPFQYRMEDILEYSFYHEGWDCD
jgi:hypothetical protein